MNIFFITAKRRNEPNSKTFVVGWRASTDNLVIEKAVTERSVCFKDLQSATAWLTWAMMHLPYTFSFKIVSAEQTEIEKNMMMWTQPKWSRYIKGMPKHISDIPFYLRKEKRA